MRYKIYIFAVIVFLLSSPALAASLDEARASLKTGQYDQAVVQGNDLGSDAGLLLAAEALNAKILLTESRSPKKDAKQAMALAGRVLQKQPRHPDAALQYAIAHGFYGRSVSTLTALRKNLPKKIKASIDTARATAPQDPQRDALLGAWHLSVVYKAGAKRAQKSYGASEARGRALMETALAAMPDDIVVRLNYAMMVYMFDPANLTEVREILSGLTTANPANEMEVSILALARKFETTLTDPKAAKKQAKDFLDW